MNDGVSLPLHRRWAQSGNHKQQTAISKKKFNRINFISDKYVAYKITGKHIIYHKKILISGI